MQTLKKLTRSVTGILVVALVVGIPVLIGRILGWLGIIAGLDDLWTPTLVGWMITIISRAALAAVWVMTCYDLIDRGTKSGWFWFRIEPSYLHREEPSVDKSGRIIGAIAATLLVLVVFEFLFRLGAWIEPPYMVK